MARIFSVLAGLSVILLATNLILGLMTGDLESATQEIVEATDELSSLRQSDLSSSTAKNEATENLEQLRQAFLPQIHRLSLHIWVGITGVLLTLLVNAVAITYFIGTARWCREVVETYDLDPSLAASSMQHKRRVFLLAFSAMLIILGIVVFGALADPVRSMGKDLSGVARWRVVHFFLTIAGTVWIVICYTIQIKRIAANSRIIQTVMGHVEAIGEQDREQDRGEV